MTSTDVGTQLRTVVIVDDSEDLRVMLGYRLRTVEGIEVVGEAADGEEAIAVVERVRPDAVVLDLAMPRMDGIEAAERLRAKFPDLLLIALTGYSYEALGDRARQAGFDHYLVKGGSLGELEELLRP